MNKHLFRILALIVTPFAANASSLSIPNTFTANTPAVAAQVNANFDAIETSVDDNDSRLDSIETIITQLQNDLVAANSTISQLQSNLNSANLTISLLQTDINDIENNTVLELDGLLKLSVIDGHDTAEFTDVNIQLNNGTNTTDGTVNGLGNFIIGYNEVLPFAPMFCSDPQYTDSASCISNLNQWDNNVHTGSHNLIVGRGQSYTKYSSLVSGLVNVANYQYTALIGGTKNIASGVFSTITGGIENIASGQRSSISGGKNNIASGIDTSILGGHNNVAFGTSSSISGGTGNLTFGIASNISGGEDNNTIAAHSHIGGGRKNETPVATQWSSISGGNSRKTQDQDDWVGGSILEDE